MEWTPPAYLELIVLSEVASGFDGNGTARELSRGDPSGVRSDRMARELSIGDPSGVQSDGTVRECSFPGGALVT